MSESAPDPRLQSLLNRLQPGPVRRVKVIGFDGADVLVSLEDTEGRGVELGRIPRHEVSMRRFDDPMEILGVGEEIEAEEIGRWREGQLHLSARACENPELRSFLVGIQPGRILSGTVSEVHNFGVFVHLDGEPEGLCTGFIRVPDLSWSRINHASEAVAVGQRVTGDVITSETREGQVTVSLKALLEDPLIRFADRVGQVVRGPITKIIPFGVFVRVADCVEGFLHLSDLAEEPVESPDQVVSEGEVITVRVAEVDLQRHRVSLRAVMTGGDAQPGRFV
ncbi:small subunit ribosomal protein S1 [Actinacidiphila yanglinensis]|uniref:Small subunit ribosomal protein S1 n=1 Tax=Actinacidiphila yanglinensis TaxID=310779 RepID=A0A1H6E8P1_9ACTN|nr:S1 RNA-binding domain-containing protein [Actinacidiphila yanglinensis]SEG94188.1 small subunit ribosomal protein S1 [Actinacidiphila yanglinensis]